MSKISNVKGVMKSNVNGGENVSANLKSWHGIISGENGGVMAYHKLAKLGGNNN